MDHVLNTPTAQLLAEITDSQLSAYFKKVKELSIAIENKINQVSKIIEIEDNDDEVEEISDLEPFVTLKSVHEDEDQDLSENMCARIVHAEIMINIGNKFAVIKFYSSDYNYEGDIVGSYYMKWNKGDDTIWNIDVHFDEITDQSYNEKVVNSIMSHLHIRNMTADSFTLDLVNITRELIEQENGEENDCGVTINPKIEEYLEDLIKSTQGKTKKRKINDK